MADAHIRMCGVGGVPLAVGGAGAASICTMRHGKCDREDEAEEAHEPLSLRFVACHSSACCHHGLGGVHQSAKARVHRGWHQRRLLDKLEDVVVPTGVEA